ncbi:uncharacterized protein [Watersipora subatra]|uniref:uncharacterized protein n=1 Tax=Watersipora subatra TaxID=2589382 RepID=UPI00355C03B7
MTFEINYQEEVAIIVSTCTAVVSLEKLGGHPSYRRTLKSTSAPDLRKLGRGHMPTSSLPSHQVGLQPTAAGGVIRKRKSLQRRTDSKRGVTFKMGLIADKEVLEEYKGALMTFDEIRSVASDDLSEIIFSKHYIGAYADFVGMNAERGYAQYTEAQIAEALQACLHIYNQGTEQNLRLVFFRDAVRHATRLSRILLFEIKPLETEEKTLKDFKNKVTQCCQMAGVNGRTVILYVHSGVPEELLGHVCSLMVDGRYPGLYSDTDMQNVATAMTPGQVQTKKLDKIELSFERYLKKVKQNVHIITAIDISASRSMETYQMLQKYPQLITKSMQVDCYKPWSNETYQYVARCWLSSPQGPEKVKWDRQLYSEQLNCMSKAMAYVQKTSEEAIVEQHCHNKNIPAHKTFGPLTFLEFFSLFTHTASMIQKRAESRVRVLKQVQGKLDEAFTSIRQQETEANNLEPRLDNSSTRVAELKGQVEAWREKYIEALDMNKKCEEKLEEKKKPLADLRGEAEAEFDKISEVTLTPVLTPTLSTSSPMPLVNVIAPKDDSPVSKEELFLSTTRVLNYSGGPHTLLPTHQPTRTLSITDAEASCSATESRANIKLAGSLSTTNCAYTASRSVVDNSIFSHDGIRSFSGSLASTQRYVQLKAFSTTLNAEEIRRLTKVNVTYYAAMAAINSLGQGALEELKSFRKPPEMIHIVGEALCIMFEQPYTDWETAQQLMFSKNFFQDMEFYDKSHLSPKIYKALGKLCSSPQFQPETIEKGSRAAAAICQWIHSVYKYAEIYKKIAPKLAKLMEAEAEVTKTQAELGQTRLYATKTKKELEDLIAEHKEASQRAKAIEQQYQTMRRKITEAKEVMNDMDLHIKIWRSELMEAENQIDCAPGDAMLVAAICCYQGPLDAHTRERLTNDWRERCHQNQFLRNSHVEPELTKIITTGHIVDPPSANDKMRVGLNSLQTIQGPTKAQKVAKQPIIISENFSLESVLSDFTEVSGWVREGIGHDMHSLHSALMLTTCASNHKNYWPLLIDPEGRAEAMLRVTNRHTARVPLESSELTDTSRGLSLSANVVLPPVAGGGDTTLTSETENESVASQSILSQTNKTQSLSIRRTSSGDDLAPVQLVKQHSQDMLDSQLRAERSIQRPPDNLWVVMATDPKLVKRVINALVHGVVLLVTHTDKKSLPDFLVDIVYKNFKNEEGGNSRHVVNVKDFMYIVHPDFRLYMSVSTFPGVKGDDSRGIAYGHCNLIDLSHSQQGRVDALLNDIMRVEKPDHEAQTRSLEGGMLQHKQELNAEQELIQKKILSGAKAILEDTSMLSTLKQSHQNISRNSQILEETLYLSNQLQQKRESYLSVGEYAAMLYEVIRYMAVISPYYCLPFNRYQALCKATVLSRHRGKGVAGEPKARCQELIDAITKEVFKLTKCMMFEDDWILLALLVTIQRMNSDCLLNAEELHVFVNDVQHIKLRSPVNSKEKPSWIEHESWMSCYKLEETLPCFSGLTESLQKRSAEWEEYFSRNMSVVSAMPGNTFSLTILQKCILWRTVLSQRFSEVCNNLLLTELGPSILNCQPLTARQLLAKKSQSRPVVMIEPTIEKDKEETEPVYSSHDPGELVESLLPKDLSHRLTLISFGTGVTMSEVESSLRHCMKNGIWLLLHNCHLAPEWSNPVLQLFTRISSIKDLPLGSSEKPKPEENLYKDLNPRINPNFRLWFSTQHSTGARLLPLTVIWNSTKYVLEQQRSYRQLLQSTYEQCLEKGPCLEDSALTVRLLASELQLPLAILHSQLLQRRRYSLAAYSAPPFWYNKDLRLILSHLRTILSKCDGSSRFTEFVVSVYKPSCTREEDAAVVEAVIRNVLKTRAELKPHEVEVNERGSQALLATLVDSSHASKDEVFERIQTLISDKSSTLSLADSAETHLCSIRSRKLLKSLAKASGHPAVHSDPYQHQDVFEKVDVLLSGWESVLHSLPLPVLPLTNSPDSQLNIVRQFFDKQVEAHRAMIQTLLRDSELLHGITRTEFSCTTDTLDMIYQLYLGKVPSEWRKIIRGSAETLMQWKLDMELACAQLIKYTEKDSSPVLYNLSAFTHPSLFLECLLIQHARSQYLDVNDLELTTEFLPMGFKPSTPPAIGCYITGLKVHNALWDTSSGLVQTIAVNDVASSNQMPILHLLPKVKAPLEADLTPRYRCPVLSSDVMEDAPQDAIMHLNLPVESLSHSQLLLERKVYISTSIQT